MPPSSEGATYRDAQWLTFCCLRQDFRRFKVNQMSDLHLTDESFRPRRVPPLRRFIDRLRAGRAAVARA